MIRSPLRGLRSPLGRFSGSAGGVGVALSWFLSGNSLQVSIGSADRIGDAAVVSAPSLSTATLDGAAVTLDAATPATAVDINDRADGTRSGGGIAINAPDASVFVAGRKWLVVYEITEQDAGVGAPFFDGAGPFSAYAGTVPGGVGSHAVLVEVDESYVDTGAQVILRAGPGGSTTFVNLALYSATWTATLPADTEFVSSSNLSLTGATSAVAAQTITALTVGDDYVLTYVLRSQTLTNLFIPQASSAFFLTDLFSSGENNTVGIHQIDLTAAKASTGALLRASGDAEFDFISLRRRGELNLQVSLGDITDSISARRPLPGRTFVSSSGSDIAGTGSVSNPLRTPTSAMSVIEAGDTVYMRPGGYQPFSVTVSGTVGNPTIVTTLPGEERLATVRGTLLSHEFYGGSGVLPGMASEDAVRVFGVSHVTVENLSVGYVARVGVNVKGPGGFASANTGIIVRGIFSEQTGSSGILVNGEDVNEAMIPIGGAAALNGVRISGCEVTQSNVITDFNNTTEDEPGGKAECISVSNGVDDVEVFDCHVRDSRQYGIDFKSGVSNGRIYGNTVRGMERYGIYLDAGERYVTDVDVYDNTVYDCRLGIVLARENDEGADATDALALEDIRVWNNILYDMERNAILLHNHPKDSDVGVIRNISVRFNTIYNADTADDRQDLAVNWGDRGTNLAGSQVVSGIDIVGNIVWTPSGTIEMILPTLPDARFVIEDNINFDDGTFAGNDPLFVNAAGGDYRLQAESPALGIVSGYSASPFNIDANGDARGDPADAGAMSLGVGAALSWFQAGNGDALDIVIDATNPGGLVLDVSGDVASIPNLGKATAADFLPTGGVNSPVADVGGRSAIQFNGGGTYQPYRGAGDYALGAFDATRRFFYLHAAEQYDLTGDQAGLSVGIDGGGAPRVNLLLKTGGVSNTVEHHNGTTARTYNGSPLQRVVGDTTVQAAYHNGTDELTMWTNGALNAIRFSNTAISAMATDPAPATNAITLGAVGNGAFDLKGNLLGAAFDNQADLTFEEAAAIHRAAFDHFGLVGRDAFAIWSLGQSNAQADFPNTATPVNRAAEDGFFRQRIGEYGRAFIRTGLGHSSLTIGASSPALYFADEWATLTGQVPLFQELAFSGQPITPGLTSKENYWAPQNAEGDAAGDTSLMEDWKDDFEGMRDLLLHSPEFIIEENIAFILEGEADAVGYTTGQDVTVPRLVGFMNAWLDDLHDLYGITTFAIVNIGRSGATEAAAAANAAGVQVVRDAWSQVIAARADSYDVFPHMVPSGPFAIDNLVVDAGGAWVSGVGYQADGLHYTTAMYQAVGRHAARQLFAMKGLT